MCGIFGFSSAKPIVVDVLVSGLKTLEYRGYDSWGAAVTANRTMQVTKQVGGIDLDDLPPLPAAPLAVAHTRWATHGGVTKNNAHPHTNEDASIAVVHNGIVENSDPLRKELMASGHQFVSETDTEVMVHLYEHFRAEKCRPMEALQRVFERIHGLNAVVVLDRAEQTLVAAKVGSPLAVGWSEETVWIASDSLPLRAHTSQVAFLEDHQGVELTNGKANFFDMRTGHQTTPQIVILDELDQDHTQGDYDSFMRAEMAQQPDVLRRLSAFGSNELEPVAAALREAASVYLIGCGTAFHAALLGARLLAPVLKKPVRAVLASEFFDTVPSVGSDDCVVVLSQSGETIDVIEPVQRAQKSGATIVSLINAPYSTLYRMGDVRLLLQAGPEQAVASTKAFLAKMTLLWMLSRYVAQSPYQDQVRIAADELEKRLTDAHTVASIHAWAQTFKSVPSLFVLGKGVFSPLALEIALKIKEISYIHAEGLATSELKHGSLALIEPGVPVLGINGDLARSGEVRSSLQEVHARGGGVYELGGLEPDKESPWHFWNLTSDVFTNMVLVTGLGQLMAHELSVQRGYNPDRPRNLAKSVTVK